MCRKNCGRGEFRNSEFRIRDSWDSGFGIRRAAGGIPGLARATGHRLAARSIAFLALHSLLLAGSQARSITFPCSQARRQREGIRIPAGFGLGEPEKATRPDSDSLPCPAGFGFGFRDSLHSFNQAKQLQASIPYGIASVTKKIIK